MSQMDQVAFIKMWWHLDRARNKENWTLILKKTPATKSPEHDQVETLRRITRLWEFSRQIGSLLIFKCVLSVSQWFCSSSNWEVLPGLCQHTVRDLNQHRLPESPSRHQQQATPKNWNWVEFHSCGPDFILPPLPLCSSCSLSKKWMACLADLCGFSSFYACCKVIVGWSSYKSVLFSCNPYENSPWFPVVFMHSYAMVPHGDYKHYGPTHKHFVVALHSSCAISVVYTYCSTSW